jgi:spore maturation protein CgeB
MGTHNPDLKKGLESVFDCYHFDWLPYTNKSHQLQADILHMQKAHKADVVFMHMQSGEVVTCETAKKLSQNSLVFNWTGDVRSPLQPFYLDIGQHITSTLFTNMNDVEYCISNGIKSDYLQVGFDSTKFNPIGKTSPIYPEIIFMGSHYTEAGFPLTLLRYQMVTKLKSEFGSRFGVYGNGWNALTNGSIDNYDEEGTAYRSCKIAINLSHFAYSRYSSDRMFRILGSGAFCLTHEYPNIDMDFTPNKDLVIWKNLDDLVKKIKKYLAMDKERETIALNGCFKARTNHTWHHFAQNLNNITKKYDKERQLDTAHSV